MVGVAQWVEHWTVAPVVGGSNPLTHPKGGDQMEKHKKEVIELKIPSLPEFVGIARLTLSGVASRMDFSYDEIEDLKIALAEACNNAILHAYANEVILVKFTMEENGLRIEVVDKGAGFDPKKTERKKPPPSEEGGMGIFLIKALVDEVNFLSSSEGTCVEMIKYLK